MSLSSSSSFLTDDGTGQDGQANGNTGTGPAESLITSNAWEGWWYDGAA